MLVAEKRQIAQLMEFNYAEILSVLKHSKGLQYLGCVFVHLSVCFSILAPHATRYQPNKWYMHIYNKNTCSGLITC